MMHMPVRGRETDPTDPRQPPTKSAIRNSLLPPFQGGLAYTSCVGDERVSPSIGEVLSGGRAYRSCDEERQGRAGLFSPRSRAGAVLGLHASSTHRTSLLVSKVPWLRRQDRIARATRELAYSHLSSRRLVRNPAASRPSHNLLASNSPRKWKPRIARRRRSSHPWPSARTSPPYPSTRRRVTRPLTFQGFFPSP